MKDRLNELVRRGERDVGLFGLIEMARDIRAFAGAPLADGLEDYLRVHKRAVLSGKKVVALMGSFSGGKTGFANTFLAGTPLPSSITPTTAVPTYVLKSSAERITVVNLWDCELSVTREELQSLTQKDSSDIRHLLKFACFEATEFPFENLAFLDTPGYSSADTLDYTMNLEFSNQADLILWFVPGDRGTVTEEDIKILKTAKPNTPKLFVINKADKLTHDEIMKVKTETKKALLRHGVNYWDIRSFSKREPHENNKIFELLKSFDENELKTSPVSDLFDDLYQGLNAKLYAESKRLYSINTALTASNEPFVTDSLLTLASEIKTKMRELKTKKNSLTEKKSDFYKILEETGIPVPQKSSGGSLADGLKTYKQKYNIPMNFEMYRITEEFSKTPHDPALIENYTQTKKALRKALFKFAETTTKENISFENSNYRNQLSNAIKLLKP